jgi:hypothetical protein
MFRLLTPGQFAICAVLFFLPWVEVQCQVPDLSGLQDGKARPRAQKTGAKSGGWVPIFSQSGLEGATGEYTILDSNMRAMVEMSKQNGAKKGSDDEIKPAPILFGYLGAVVAGAVLGLVLPCGWARKGILLVVCAVAGGTVGWQASKGMPLAQGVQEVINKDRAKGAENDDGVKPEEVMKTKYKVPFYLALALIATATLTVLVEPVSRPKAKPVPPRPAPDNPFESPPESPPPESGP